MALSGNDRITYNRLQGEMSTIISILNDCFALKDTETIVDDNKKICMKYISDMEANTSLYILKEMYESRLFVLEQYDILDKVTNKDSINYSNIEKKLEYGHSNIQYNGNKYDAIIMKLYRKLL